MQFRSRRSAVIAAVLVTAWMAASAAGALAQAGRPEYKPEVEAVARTIFLDLLSPY